MARFDISVNGRQLFRGDDVTAVTLASDRGGRDGTERVIMHVGIGEGEREVDHFAADLIPSDEIIITVLDAAEIDDPVEDVAHPSSGCSFCGSSYHEVHSLVASHHEAICDACISSLSAVVREGAALPVGASIRTAEDAPSCAFCDKRPPSVPAVLVRNDAAICPICLRSCVDLHEAGVPQK